MEAGLRRARATGGATLVSVTAAASGTIDPSAIVRGLAAAGRALVLVRAARSRGDGAGRRSDARARSRPPARTGSGSWRVAGARSPARRSRIQETVRRARAWSPSAGFAFAPDGGESDHWSGFAPASLDRAGGLARSARRPRELTVNVEARARRHGGRRARARGAAAAAGCGARRCRCIDPAPTGAYRVQSAMPPAHYEEAVARAVQRIRSGELEKIVLAREVDVHAPDRPRSGGAARRAARGVRLLLRVRGRARRRDVRRRQPGAAGSARGPAREHGRAGRLDRAQRRSCRRRPPRRAAAPKRQGPGGERDRRAAGSPARCGRCRCG